MAKKGKAKKGKIGDPAGGEMVVRAGVVIRNTGSSYVVLTDGEGEEIEARAKGSFRLKGIRTTNPVAVGDRVTVRTSVGDGSSYITEIEPRRNYVIRRASNLSKEASILAANVDQACLVVTLAHPRTSTTFIDRFLATAEAYRVPAVLVINKVDLLDGERKAEMEESEDGEVRVEEEITERELLDAVTYLYESVGYKVIAVSAKTGEGIEELRRLMEGKTSLLAGNSGVGKSTIINALIPGLNVKTGEISQVHDTGMHTTTFSEMYRLPEGGWVVDTPGVRGFGTIEFDPKEVSHFFPEIFKVGQGCRYGDCTHTHEPQCAVRAGLERHEIAESRYQSYLSIMEDANEDKYRQGY